MKYKLDEGEKETKESYEQYFHGSNNISDISHHLLIAFNLPGYGYSAHFFINLFLQRQ